MLIVMLRIYRLLFIMTNQTSTISPEEVEKFSRIAEEWWDENGKFKPLHRMNPMRIEYIRNKTCTHFGKDAAVIKPLAGLSLLDVGCGGGLLCEPFTRLGAAVTGIDASEKNIKVASLHAEKMGLKIDYRCTAAEAMSEQYDVVLAMEIVEHVADVPTFLKAVSALVKPGGILFMSTLNRTIKSYAMAIVGAEYILRWLPRGTHDWKKFVKPAELCGGLRNEGLNIQHMTGTVFNPLNQHWSTNDRDLDVNYILTANKAA
jgi:2-polyprenyl-6-hydroxyphenyl methylase/3-demethylubiquinone-9 3-methyltransferase